MDVLALCETVEKLGATEPEVPAEIASYEDAADPAVKGGGWSITTIQGAEWALMRKAECEAEIADIDAARRDAIAKINARAEELKAKAERGVAYFDFKLVAWMEANRSSIVKGQKKSRALLHGVVGWRSSGGRLRVTDEKALEAWLMAQPIESGLFRLRYEPEMKALQKLNETTGVIPDGCEYEPERDHAYTKAEAPEAALMKKGA